MCGHVILMLTKYGKRSNFRHHSSVIRRGVGFHRSAWHRRGGTMIPMVHGAKVLVSKTTEILFLKKRKI